jgi:hypothetical protein
MDAGYPKEPLVADELDGHEIRIAESWGARDREGSAFSSSGEERAVRRGRV